MTERTEHSTLGPAEMRAGRPSPLGATVLEGGVNFAVFSTRATRIDICLFSPDGAEETARLPLPERSGPVWHGFLPGLEAGALYGLRADGPYAPAEGDRFNPNKLLLDPYAPRLHGEWRRDPALHGFDLDAGEDADLSFSEADSAPFVPRAVVTAPQPPLEAARPRRPWSETVIYEAHAKGFTKRFPGLPEDVAGSYEALARPEVIEHLLSLGVTAVELLPIHEFIDDAFLLDKGLKNYWGYNTISFFALAPRYFGPTGELGFRDSVERLHEAGIEVILDVVYNHTAEGDQRGPTLSFRGLDNAAYYRLEDDDPRFYANDTGCGNMLDFSHPFVIRLALDSLRYWVSEMGVDGFRFDLATVLGREENGFTQGAGFFDALRQDPVLSEVKLIAEPWDIGPEGYRRGEFPPEFGEWNVAYRDGARSFWRGDRHAPKALAGLVLGSADTFDHGGRRPQASINMLTAHDGFTLADVTAYSRRRNRANGEGGRDGHGANVSDNCGAEGPSEDLTVIERRRRRRMNLLATLFLSQGTPMLLAGDEIGNSQSGNNNAYCQDNEIGWVNWSEADEALLRFTRRLIALRRDRPILRQTRFLHGDARADGAPDVAWAGLDGGDVAWSDPALAGFRVCLRGAADRAAYDAVGDHDEAVLYFNRGDRAVETAAPERPEGQVWLRELDSAAPDDAAATLKGERLTIQPHSVVALFTASA